MKRSVDICLLPEEVQKALEQFQEFQISEFNDTGANGYVMIGRHSVLRKDVAIKIYFHEENEIDQEPAIIASINHENVLKVYDARKVKETCSYYMMQVANAGDLYSFLNRYYISLTLAHRLLCQLLSGLSSLHCNERKLVHRDLKPENLLVHNDKIVIADFGSVRKVSEATGRVSASKHSILYRPPEAFGNDAFFDFSSDIYQAGMIGYLLFGGELSNDLLHQLNKKERKELEKVKADGGDYEISVFIDSCVEKRIRTGKVMDWSSLPFYVPNKVKRVLKASVAIHGKRYSNVSEFLAELAKVKAILPNWMKTTDGFLLEDWNGNDYLLFEENGNAVLKKRKHGREAFRSDNSVKGNSLSDAFGVLKKQIGLP
jgi:serine/threonine protein kinase